MKTQLQYFAEAAEENIQPEGEKTFTQEDVNRIVSKRLSEEKQKAEADIAKREAQLKQKQFQLEAKAMLKEKGLPDTLLSVLKGDDIETFSKSVEILKQYENSRIETHRVGIDSGVTKTTAIGDKIRNAMGL